MIWWYLSARDGDAVIAAAGYWLGWGGFLLLAIVCLLPADRWGPKK